MYNDNELLNDKCTDAFSDSLRVRCDVNHKLFNQSTLICSICSILFNLINVSLLCYAIHRWCKQSTLIS